MHDEVAVGQLLVDRDDAVHRQHFAVGLASELVGSVAGADGDGQGIDARLLDEILGLVGIGQQLLARELADGAVAVFLFAFAVFQRAEAAEFAFDGDVLRMGQLHDFGGDADVVVVVGRRLAVFLQRAVHHHAGEAVLDGAGAGGGAVAVVLVHDGRESADTAPRRPASGA